MHHIDGDPFGNGEFSSIYKDQRNQKYYVIKTIKSELIKTDEERNSLMREIRLQACLYHKTILELV